MKVKQPSDDKPDWRHDEADQQRHRVFQRVQLSGAMAVGVGAGCAIFTVLLAVVLAAQVRTLSSGVKRAFFPAGKLCELGLDAAREDPQALELLGQKLKLAAMISGSREAREGQAVAAQCEAEVRGSESRGYLMTEGTFEHDRYTLLRATFKLRGQEEIFEIDAPSMDHSAP